MDRLISNIRRMVTPTKENFLWMMLGNGSYAVCQWGMLVVLAKFGSPEVVGVFALAFAIISPVMMVTNMQLRGVQATDAKREYLLADYLAVRVMSTAVAFIVISAILYFGRVGKAVVWATGMLALAKAVESLSDVLYGFFQQREKMSLMAKSMIMKGALSVAVVGGIFYALKNLTLALAGLGGAWLLVFMLYDRPRAARLLKLPAAGEHPSSLFGSALASLRERPAVLFSIGKLAFPLGIVMGIISLNANIPRYAINKFLGARELGIFAALAYTTVAIDMFMQALGQATAPRLARNFAAGDLGEFKRMLTKMVLINLTVGLTGVLIILAGGKEILRLIYTPEYAMFTTLFVMLMVAAMLSGIASALGYAMTAARQFNRQVPLFVTVLVSTAFVSYHAIPVFGVYGAAVALIISAFIQGVGSWWIVFRAMSACGRLRTQQVPLSVAGMCHGK